MGNSTNNVKGNNIINATQIYVNVWTGGVGPPPKSSENVYKAAESSKIVINKPITIIIRNIRFFLSASIHSPLSESQGSYLIPSAFLPCGALPVPALYW